MSGTYISKIPVLVVALVIGIVLVTSAVVPLASDYSDAKTFKNEGYFNLEKYDTSEDLIIFWDHTKPSTITINGSDVSLDGIVPTNIWVDLVVGDYSFLRYADGATTKYVQFYYGASAGNRLMVASSGSDDLKITCHEGTASGVVVSGGVEGTAQTTTYTELYVISDTGPYVMKKSDKSAYMADDSELIAFGTTDIGSGIAMIKITGNVEDVDVSIIGATVACSVDESSISINSAELAEYEGSSLNKITFKVTSNNTAYDVTYSYFIVPSEVTLESSHPAAYKNLIKVVPLMAFIMLVVAAAGMVYLKNKD